MAKAKTERLEQIRQAALKVGMACDMLDAQQSGLDLSTLLIALPGEDEDAEPRFLSVTLLPDDGAMEQFDLLQAWLSLGPVRDGDGQRLADANPASPIGHAAVRDGEIHYRHVWPMPFGMDVTPDMLEEWLSLFSFSADILLDAIRS